MTDSYITRSLRQIKIQTSGLQQKYIPVLLSDSKGSFIKREVTNLDELKIEYISQSDIQKLEAFQKKTFKQILSLPQRTADAAIYIWLGAESIEQLVHKAVISLFLRISKDPNSIECKIGIRQLAKKDDKSNSWYINVDKTLKSYDLPSAHEIILNPQKNWKRLTHDVIDKTWKNRWIEIALSKSTLNTLVQGSNAHVQDRS